MANPMSMPESTIQEFRKVFSSLFQEESDAIHGDTKFRDLEEWSSMQALIVIVNIVIVVINTVFLWNLFLRSIIWCKSVGVAQ